MSIKKLVLAIALCTLVTSLAWAQSVPATDVDGIWAIQGASTQQQRDASYFSIRAAPSGLLVIIRLGTYDWQAYVTTLVGNSATVVTITTQAINSWKIDFTSAQQATVTGLICIQNVGGGPVPLVSTPTVGSVTPTATTDVTGMPIYAGNRCFVPQGAVFPLAKVL